MVMREIPRWDQGVNTKPHVNKDSGNLRQAQQYKTTTQISKKW